MEVWEKVLADCRAGVYDGGGLMPSCSTFSAARSSPSEEGRPRRCGDPRVRSSTALRIFCWKRKKGCVWAHCWRAERPRPPPPSPRAGVAPAPRGSSRYRACGRITLACSSSTSPASWTSYPGYRRSTPFSSSSAPPAPSPRGEFGRMPEDCPRVPVRWKVPWPGEEYTSPHPRLRGAQWPVRAEQWHPSMMPRREPFGDFITRGAAGYPQPLNEFLAYGLLRTALATKTGATPSSARPYGEGEGEFARVGKFGKSIIRVKRGSSHLKDIDPSFQFSQRLGARRGD